jgi:hypothetical protein
LGDTVFDPREAFSPLNGTSYPDLRELLRALGRLRWDYLAELPTSFGVSELMELARARNWLVEKPRGGFSIRLDGPRGKRRVEGSPASRRRQSSKPTKAKTALGV